MGLFTAVYGWWQRLTTKPAHAPAMPVLDARTAPKPASNRPAVVSPNDVFTPTRPRAGRRSLVGRQVELERILDGILDDRAHVVLYSERGRGKTSLSNLVSERLRRRGVMVARCACEAETTFDTMIRALARDLPRSLVAQDALDPDSEGCEAILPHRAIRPADVAAIPDSLSCDVTVFLIDEFDRVTDLETRTRLADTIKLLSDRGTRLYFMVVGVSDTLEQIIGQHPSIQRNIVGVHLPLLRREEVAEMLVKGGHQAGIAFTAEATRIVQDVARGMPYMAQLLGLRIAQAALRRGDDDTHVEEADVLAAVQRLLDETSSPVTATYASLSGKPLLAGAVQDLANAEQDDWGRMAVARLPEQVVVGGCRLPAGPWQRLLDMGILVQPDGPAGPAQFKDRVLVYHILLLAARKTLTARSAANAGARADIVHAGSGA